MANDFLWIRHKETGDVLCLYKYYPSGGYLLLSKEEIEGWIDEHMPFTVALPKDGGLEFISDYDERLKIVDGVVRTDPDA